MDNDSNTPDFDMKSTMEEVRADRRRTPIQFQANKNVLAVIDGYAAAHRLTRAASVRELVLLGGKAISVFGDVPEEETK